jgi:hypothetical protein
MATALKTQYEAEFPKREPFLRRARQYAELTVPSLLPPMGHNFTSDLPEPYNEFGGDAVPYLASKFLLALLPPNELAARLEVSNEVLLASGKTETPPDVESGLAKSELLIRKEVERLHWREATYLTIQLLLVTGSACEVMTPDALIKVFRLDQFVTVRDAVGKMVKTITLEEMHPSTVPEELQWMIDPAVAKDPNGTVELYTGWFRQPDGRYKTYQELNGKRVPKSLGYYDEDTLNVWCPRWAAVPKENYGRSKIEEHIGAFRTLENASRSVVEGIAMASRHITLVSPNAAGGNLRARIAKANNGAVLSGREEDVKMLKFENINGVELADQTVVRVTQKLAAAFLKSGDMRRDAERVTAEEIRMLAQEIESGLGGAYTLLASNLMAPRFNRLIYLMKKSKRLPDWPKKTINVTLTTGIAALGRAADAQKYAEALGVVVKLPEQYQARVKDGDLLKGWFTARGLPAMVKTDAEMQQEMQQRMAMEAAQAGATAGAEAVGTSAAQPQPTE